jgi:hypothetical protein
MRQVRDYATSRVDPETGNRLPCRLFWWNQTTERLVPMRADVPTMYGDEWHVGASF